VKFLGVGLQNQYQSEYQMAVGKWLVPACHQTRVILTQPLNHRMPVSRNDLRDLRDWRKCKLAFPSLSLRCLGWVYKNENEYQMAES
jgi:hypothetical protein